MAMELSQLREDIFRLKESGATASDVGDLLDIERTARESACQCLLELVRKESDHKLSLQRQALAQMIEGEVSRIRDTVGEQAELQRKAQSAAEYRHKKQEETLRRMLVEADGLREAQCAVLRERLDGLGAGPCKYLEERMDNLEDELGHSAQKHVKVLKDIETCRSAHEQLAKDFQRHAGMEQRVNDLGRTVGDAVGRNEEMAADLRNLANKHPALEQRLAFLERELGDSTEKHMRLVKDWEGHQNAHGQLVREVQRFGSTEERFNCLEKSVGDAENKYEQLAREVDVNRRAHIKLTGDFREAYGKMSSDLRDLASTHRDSTEKHMRVVKDFEGHQNAHAQLAREVQRYAGTEKRINDFERNVSDLESKHAELVRDLDAHRVARAELRDLANKHPPLEQRLAFIEKQLLDSSEREMRILKDWEGQQNAQGQLVREVERNSSTEQRVYDLERVVGNVQSKHSELVNHLDVYRTAMADARNLANKHPALEQRLDFIEKKFFDSTEKHMRLLKDWEVHQRTLPEPVWKEIDHRLNLQRQALVQMVESSVNRIRLSAGEQSAADSRQERSNWSEEQLEQRVVDLEKKANTMTDSHAQLVRDVAGALTSMNNTLQERLCKVTDLQRELQQQVERFRSSHDVSVAVERSASHPSSVVVSPPRYGVVKSPAYRSPSMERPPTNLRSPNLEDAPRTFATAFQVPVMLDRS